MTDNEIIKALECCIHDDYDYCEECPYLKNKPCHEGLIQDAFDLINRQKAEIERLEEQDEIAEKIIREQADKIFSLQSENGRLTDRNSVLSEKADNSIITCVSTRTEAIKEFAERLIDLINCIPQHHFTLGQVEHDIDNLVKEMVGEESG